MKVYRLIVDFSSLFVFISCNIPMIANEISAFGNVHSTERLNLVHVSLPQGKSVPAHDHPGVDVYFTLIRGEVKTILDGSEEHHLTPGSVLSFPGEPTISIEALVDSEFFVYLVKR